MTREFPHLPVALHEVAHLFGALVAETILASVHVRARKTGRTYGRKRSDQNTANTPCKEGAVHIREMYLETMQNLLTDTDKVIMDRGVQGVVPYLPLDQLRRRSGAAAQ